jgi:hypothetical protein
LQKPSPYVSYTTTFHIHVDIHPLPLEVNWKLKYKMRKWTESRNSNGAVVLVAVVRVIVTALA